MAEARNVSGNITAQYCSWGQTISGTNYYYTCVPPIGSIGDVTDGSGNVQAQISYDPYGRANQISGSIAPDFQYAGYYFHAPSGLNLTLTRAYSPKLGRWISRDPIGEVGGINLYEYAKNDPVLFKDPSGRAPTCSRLFPADDTCTPPKLPGWTLKECKQWCIDHCNGNKARLDCYAKCNAWYGQLGFSPPY